MPRPTRCSRRSALPPTSPSSRIFGRSRASSRLCSMTNRPPRRNWTDSARSREFLRYELRRADAGPRIRSRSRAFSLVLRRSAGKQMPCPDPAVVESTVAGAAWRVSALFLPDAVRNDPCANEQMRRDLGGHGVCGTGGSRASAGALTPARPLQWRASPGLASAACVRPCAGRRVRCRTGRLAVHAHHCFNWNR
jgi:hypothetical protein